MGDLKNGKILEGNDNRSHAVWNGAAGIFLVTKDARWDVQRNQNPVIST
jgi:hypothetical protein